MIHRYAEWIVLTLVALNFALSLAALSLRIPWLDESFTVLRIWESWDVQLVGKLTRQWSVNTTDIQPPLYFALLKLWGEWVGTDVFLLRFISVASITATVSLSWAGARCLFDKTTGLFAALLASISPAYLWVAGEIRMYAFVVAIAGAWFYLTALLLTSKQPFLILPAWLLVAALALASHYALVVVLPAHGLAALAMLMPRRSHSWLERRASALISLGALVLVSLLALGLAIPLLPVAKYVASVLLRGSSAIGPLDAIAFVKEIGDAILFGLAATDPTGGALSVLLFVSAGSSLFLFVNNLLKRVWLALCVAGPVIGLLSVSSFTTHRPSFRYVIAVVLPLHIVAARVLAQWLIVRGQGYAALVRRALGLLGVVAILGSPLWGLNIMFAPTPTRQDDWGGLTDFLRREWQPGDATMLNLDSPESVLSQYLAETSLPLLVGLKWTGMPRDKARELLHNRFARIWLLNTGGDNSFLSAELRDLLSPYLLGRQVNFPARTTILDLREYWLKPPFVAAMPSNAISVQGVDGKTSIVGVEILPGNPYHPEGNFRLRLYWQPGESKLVNRLDARLINNAETWLLWSGDALPWPLPAEWKGPLLATTYAVPVPPGLPHQPYELRLTLRSGVEKLEITQEATVRVSQDSVACCIRRTWPELPSVWRRADVTLNRAEFPASVRRGETLPVVLTWTPRRVLSNWESVLELLPSPFHGLPGSPIPPLVVRRSAGSADASPSTWPVGEPTRDQYALPIPFDTPAGWYVLRLRREGAEPFDRESLTLGLVQVSDYPRTPIPRNFQRPVRANVGDLILLGLSLPEDVKPGSTIEVQTCWEVARQPKRDGRIFVHLYDAEGRLIAQDDDAPFNGQRSTLSFQAGDGIVQVHRLTLPPDLPAGRYVLRGGVYDSSGEMERWPALQDGQPALHNLVSLGELVIR